FVVGRAARGYDAGPDPATSCSNFGERGTTQAFGILVMAFAREQWMAVALDQARQHASSPSIDRRNVVIAVCSKDIGRRAYCDDLPIPNGHRAVGDDVEIGLRWSAPDLTVVVNLGQRRGVHDVEVVHRQ